MNTRKVTPENISSLADNEVFVFGSNKVGRHGAGAARLALDKFGAVYGQGEGLQGQSYGFVTLNKYLGKVSLRTIKSQFNKLFECAKENPDKVFLVTKVGCGLAGYEEQDIVDQLPEYEDIPENIALPQEWINLP
jgi:hypothetical protein